MVATAREHPTVDNDEIAYNPSSDVWHDRAEFDDADDFESARPIAARGAESQPTDRNFTQEDVETERSEQTGKIPRCKFALINCVSVFQLMFDCVAEVNDLLDSATAEEKDVSGRTRGKKNDAWKQEKELDQAYADADIDGEDEDF